MNEQAAVSEKPRKVGSIKRSWLITKSTWRIFVLDKEILWVPVLSGLTAILIAILGFGGGYILTTGAHIGHNLFTNNNPHPNNWSYTVWFVTAALLALVTTYTLAAMIGIALKRLRGGNPTLRDGMQAIKKNFAALTIFSLFSFGVVQGLQYLQNRLPLAGKILAFLGQIAWGIGAFFAVPVIVDADESVGPIKATKQSLNLIKHTWKESGGANFFVATIFTLAVVLELVIGIATGAALWVALGPGFGIAVGLLVLPLLLLTILISSALEGIAKAVLFYYATTGEAPAEFDKRLLQEAFTAKKARKLFA